MAIEVLVATAPPERDAMNGVLQAYYTLIIDRLEAIGGQVPDRGEGAIAEFWDEIETYMPPKGCLVLAKDEHGTIVGCGCLKVAEPGVGELKRLYVEPHLRGAGIGRKLVDLRIDVARQMGIKRLVVDTVKNNHEMRGLYEKLGFTEVLPNPDSSTVKLVPGLVNILKFYEKEL